MLTILLLIGSNIFMTFAWYGHLKYRDVPIWKVIVVSWSIAFFEYCLQVPANRIGYRSLTGYQLKVIQEAIALVVFMGFAAVWLGEKPSLRYVVAFGLILAAVAVAIR